MRLARTVTTALSLTSRSSSSGSSSSGSPDTDTPTSLAATMATTPLPPLQGVVFDMDGTLAVPNIDFARMYQRCGVDPAVQPDILAAVAAMDAAQAAACHAIIAETEAAGRSTLQLMPGAPEVLTWLQRHGIPTALVTRNTQRTVDRLTELLSDTTNHCFDMTIPRDSPLNLPPKPHPAALLHIAAAWKCLDKDGESNNDDKTSCASLLMVGDSPLHDVGFGQAAGATTALLDTTWRHGLAAPPSATACVPDVCVSHLWELPRQLWRRGAIPGSHAPLLPDAPPPPPQSVASIAAAQGDLARLQGLPPEAWTAVEAATGHTPLLWAAHAGHVAVVEFLVHHVAPSAPHLNVRGYRGATAVARAAGEGHAACVQLLAAAGADLNIPNDQMDSPLHAAAGAEHHACVDMLLDYGANPWVLDRQGRTPSLVTQNAALRQRFARAMPCAADGP
jgi:phosphoglycolate phosphatase-like HAD superfamily hydrolase